MSSSIEKLAGELAKLASAQNRHISKGYRSLNGGWHTHVDDDESTIVVRGYSYSNKGAVTLRTLLDGTLTVRDGKLQFRRLPDGSWVTRSGRDVWTPVSEKS